MIVEFFYDYGSPFSYLANRVLPEQALLAGATVSYRPMLLGGVFKETGNQPPMQESVAAKRNYNGAHMARCAALYDLETPHNPHFPIITLGVMRLAVAAQREGHFEAFHRAVFDAFWGQGRDLGDPAVQAEVLRAADLDHAGLLRRAGEDDIKAELRANTSEAVARGAFGAPTFFVGEEMFFGIDHLPHLLHFLKGRSG